MNFLDLPVEVGVIIFNYLDTKTKINVYNSSEQIREYFASGWCHLNSVVLSRSTLATVNTLHETLFANLGEHIRDLNLSGVQDLTVQNIKPHMHKFKTLKSLDITYTNIYLPDIGEVCPPSVKNIAINFFKCPNSYKNESTHLKCREIFKERQFEAIHFVVFEFVVSASPLKFLKGAPLIKDLKLTISDHYKDFFDLSHPESRHSDAYEVETNFNKITYVFYKLSTRCDRISKLDFNQLEYIFIMYLDKISIYVSPVFTSMFTTCYNDLKVEVSTCLPKNFMLDCNIKASRLKAKGVLKAWNKATTTFNDEFFSKLLLEIKDYIPTYVCMLQYIQRKKHFVKAPSSWYCIDSCENFEKKLNDLPDKITLTDVCRHDGIVRWLRRPISLSKECKTIRHLTFLRIHNVPLRKDFFTNLFTACPKLVTLDIYVEKYGMIHEFTGSLSKAIQIAKLKNFMLTSEDIEYEIIFEILSQCVSLENVHICEYERATNDDEVNSTNIVNFIEKCVNLYSLYIEADMTGEGLTMLMAPLRIAAQTLERDYLYVEVCESYCGWNPFVDVFNPSPLHILN